MVLGEKRLVSYKFPLALIQAIEERAATEDTSKTEIVVRLLSEALGLAEGIAMSNGIHQQVHALATQMQEQSERLEHVLTLLQAQADRVEQLELTLFNQAQTTKAPSDEPPWLTKEEAFALLGGADQGLVSDLYGRQYRWNTFRKLPSSDYGRFGFQHDPQRAYSKQPCLRMTAELRRKLLFS